MARLQEPHISRVVVTLEPDAVDPGVLANAARLARAYDAELVGLFVKLQDYLNLADLPFTRSVVAATGEIRPVDKGRMERALDEAARRAEKGISEQAAQRQVRWSFQTFAGHAEDVVAANTTDTDIVSLSGGIAATIRTGGRDAWQPAMVITHQGLRGGRPVTVVYDGQASTLAVGRRISSGLGVGLSVLVTASAADEVARQRRNIQSWLRRHQMSAQVQYIQPDQDVMDQLTSAHPGLVVVSRHSPMGQKITNYLERLEPDMPVVLVDGVPKK